MKMKKWIHSGGGKMIGFSEDGERLYTITNGTAALIAAALAMFFCLNISILKFLICRFM